MEDLSGEELDRLLGELSNHNKDNNPFNIKGKNDNDSSPKNSLLSYGSEIEAALDEELNKVIEKENKNTINGLLREEISEKFRSS